MPSAGRMRPNTMSSGSLTTPRHSPVSTMTFSATLVNRPKKPFQSPWTHQAGVAVRALAMALLLSTMLVCYESGSGETGEQRSRRRHPSEDAALRLDHRQAHRLELREVGAGAVLQHQAIEAAIVRLAHRRVDADLGGDATHQQPGDAAAAQHGFQVGGVERALARLV